MSKVIGKLLEIEKGTQAAVIYSTKDREVVSSIHEDELFPLASAAKLAVGYAVAQQVKRGELTWEHTVDDVTFNPLEDSEEIYPHYQGRTSLSLREAVEVMIAAHDTAVAEAVVQVGGGWKQIHDLVQKDFRTMDLQEDPRDVRNQASAADMFYLIQRIYDGYQQDPQTFGPVISGLVRQQDHMLQVPSHHLNHMTGGLEHAIVDIGILGSFHEYPFLYVVAVKDVPDRRHHKRADEKVIETIQRLYKWVQ
ncbi:class A beta-lactamase-related serine hydrolase [Halobacillus litoralis]|uniref:serine hydrolase n=1 Tax=Halobacillus litoralis TaxID=45668 RepID=UPI001CD36BA6|nr:serine hydrolase [Halobacillus litoralis]MCA0969268.1 class A beta-lactamase-related serine hydrolase [Halobacillus litoralis]